MTNQEYDVVIVGAGISGAMTASVLSNQGYKVLILEASSLSANRQENIDLYYSQAWPWPGNDGAPTPKYPAGDKSNWQDPPNAPPPHNEGYWMQSGDYDFNSTYDRTLGGTTNHWMGTALRNFPDDFKLKSELKCTSPWARDWPIGYSNLVDYYYAAEQIIGVSGEKNYFKSLGMPEETKDYPMPLLPLSYSDQRLAETVDKLSISTPINGLDVQTKVFQTPQARNSTMYDKRPRCMGNSSCTPICPIQAKYDASVTINRIIAPLTAEEIKNGSKRVPVTLRTQCVVDKVVVGDDDQVSEISYIEYTLKQNLGTENSSLLDPKSYEVESQTSKTVTASIYVLAAHAIEIPKLLLNSPWKKDVNGTEITVANSSDQVGRNLMDHICLVHWGLTPEPVYQYRGPGSTGCIPQFRNVKELRKEYAAFRIEIGNFGWSWPTFAPPTTLQNLIDPSGAAPLPNGETPPEAKPLYGSSLRTTLGNQISSQLRIAMEIESVAFPESRVTLATQNEYIKDTYPDARTTDSLGIPRPVLNYALSEYTLKGASYANTVAKKIFKEAGIRDFSWSDPNDPGYVPERTDKSGNKLGGFQLRGAGHVIGTTIMGDNPDDSVVDANQRCHDHTNMYIVGSSVYPTTATANPTLTIAATSLRVGVKILEQLDPSLVGTEINIENPGFGGTIIQVAG
jgi:choline dehydrogenase-like flavoprotein